MDIVAVLASILQPVVSSDSAETVVQIALTVGFTQAPILLRIDERPAQTSTAGSPADHVVPRIK